MSSQNSSVNVDAKKLCKLLSSTLYKYMLVVHACSYWEKNNNTTAFCGKCQSERQSMSAFFGEQDEGSIFSVLESYAHCLPPMLLPQQHIQIAWLYLDTNQMWPRTQKQYRQSVLKTRSETHNLPEVWIKPESGNATIQFVSSKTFSWRKGFAVVENV